MSKHTFSNMLHAANAYTQVLAPQVVNSDTLCTEIDMQGYEELELVVLVGNSADTLNSTNKIEIEVQDCATSEGSYAAVANTDLTNYVTATNTGTIGLINAPTEDTTVFIAGYRGPEQFVKVKLNFSGTHSTGTPIGILAVRKANIGPVNSET